MPWSGSPFEEGLCESPCAGTRLNFGTTKGGAPKGGPPKGGAPKDGAPKGGARKGGGPKISRCFFLARHNFHSFFLSLGVLAWNFCGV